MPESPYIQLKIAGNTIDIPQSRELPVSITYEIEDDQDFRQKKPGSALNVTVPATTNNSSKLNTLFNPGSEDTLPDDGFDKPMNVVLVGSGDELMKGKAFVLRAREQFGKPLNFDINIFGDNADWAIPNKELTLHDVVTEVTHVFNKTNIQASWAFDGTVITQDYVYAPVRYREPFGLPEEEPDVVCRPENMKPSLFIYPLLYRGFKLAGYKITSQFMDSEYFRRLVMPWTWDEFLYIKVDNLRCRAKKTGSTVLVFGGTSGSINVLCNNDSTLGCFDNGITLSPPVGCYNYDSIGKTMNWFYLSGILPSPGTITASFSVRVRSSYQIPFPVITASVSVRWYINGVSISTETIYTKTSGVLSGIAGSEEKTVTFLATGLVPGDTVSAEVRATVGGGGATTVAIHDVEFKTNYFRAQQGTNINFKSHDGFKQWKWLDLLRGLVDSFNLQFNTDPITKTVVIEPTHPFTLQSTGPQPGYYNGNLVSWSGKRDLSKVSEVEVYQDYEKEVVMRMKDDPSDGLLKTLQDRKKVNVSAAKYVFPDRFKKGSKDIENRFFSSVVHYDAWHWAEITDVAPQLIILVPENINNTSNTESQNTLRPKLAYYKGLVDKGTYGGWDWDGDQTKDLPFLFAVNYRQDGQLDPVLTYCDQRVEDGGGGYYKAFGLLRTFFLQRFAIMRHGKKYAAHFTLNNTDVVNQLHREFKTIDNQRYQLISINGYKPLLNESVMCRLWKWYPITLADNESLYPSNASVMTSIPAPDTPDTLYTPLKVEPSDVSRFQ